MPAGDTGINKPFDRILKSFADEEPGLFLRLVGLTSRGIEVDIEPLRPETAPAVVLPDFVALVQRESGVRIVFHAEFESRYSSDVPGHMARYGGSLGWQHQIPVESVLVLLRPEGVPAAVPEVGHYNIGLTHTTHSYKVVRLWDVEPTPVLETGNPKLLPWALLMKTTEAQVREIATIVAAQGDDEAVSRFLQLGSIRYDRSTLVAMLGGRRMGLVRAFLDGSSIVREEREEGRLEGRSEGHLEEARKLLRRLLRKYYSNLELLPEIDRISDVAMLESLIETTVEADGEEFVRTAILEAAAKLN